MLSSYRRLLKVFLILLVSAHESSASCLCGDDSNDESNNTESNSENSASAEAKAAAQAKLRAELKEELKAEMQAAAEEAEGKTRASNTHTNVGSTTSKVPSTDQTDGNVSTVQVTVEVKKSDGEPFEMPNIIFNPAGVTQPQASQAPLPVVNNANPSASPVSQSGAHGAVQTSPAAHAASSTPKQPFLGAMNPIVDASRAATAVGESSQSGGKLKQGDVCTSNRDCESGFCEDKGSVQICQPKPKVDQFASQMGALKGNLFNELSAALEKRKTKKGNKKPGDGNVSSNEDSSSEDPQTSDHPIHDKSERSGETKRNLRGGNMGPENEEPESESPSESNTDVSGNATSGEGNDEASGSNVASAAKKENGEICESNAECKSGKCHVAKMCVPAGGPFGG